MTGHTSNEVIDIPQEERSTDSDSATKFPAIKPGVVQDSPGTHGSGTEDTGRLTETGDYKKDDDSMLGTSGDNQRS